MRSLEYFTIRMTMERTKDLAVRRALLKRRRKERRKAVRDWGESMLRSNMLWLATTPRQWEGRDEDKYAGRDLTETREQ